MKSTGVFLTFCFVTIYLLVPAFAQDLPEEVEPQADVIEEAEESGDVLVLKGGDRITGFQIIRTTHRHYVLEGFYDPETDESLEIKVSRGQVVEVIRDDIDPDEQRAEAMKKALARQRTTVEGARLSDTLYGLLERVIGDPPLNTDGLNLVQVLEEVNKRVDGALTIGPAVKKPTRKWKGVIGPDTTLAMFLDNQVAPSYPGLAISFEENAVSIRPKGKGPANGGRGGPPPAARPAASGRLPGLGNPPPPGGGE